MQKQVKWFLLAALLVPCWVIGIKYEIDLVVLHATAQFLNSDLTRVYAQNGILGRYFYGPFSLILIKPLGYLSFPTVKYFWLCLQTLSYFVFWHTLTQLYPILNNPKAFWGWLLVWIMAINPIHNNFQSNNIQLMLATVLVLAESLCQKPSKKAQIWGGLLVAFTAGIKVFPAFLVVYYFIAKSSSTRKGIIIGCLIVALSPFVVLGPSKAYFLYQGFIGNLTTYSADNSLTKTNDILCLPSLLARWGFTSSQSNALVLFLSALFFVWVFLRKSRPNFTSIEPYLLAFAWTLSVLLNPSTRPHYFIFYVPAYCILINRLQLKDWSKTAIGCLTLVSALLIAFTAEGVVGKPLNELLEAASIPTYGMLILCLSLLFALRNEGSFAKAATNV